MADNNEQSKIPETAPVAAIEIPNLKKKEKERKKGGAAWSGAGRTGAWEGATGGARAAASAVAEGAAGEAAAVEEGLLSSIMSRLEGTFLGRLLNPMLRLLAELASTGMGRAVLAAMAALLAAGAVAVAMKLMGGHGQVAGSANLEGISSSIKIHRPGDISLGDAAIANRGALLDGAAKADKADKTDKADQAAQADKADGVSGIDKTVDADPAAPAADMALGAAHITNPRLSSDLGGGMQSGTEQALNGKFSLGNGRAASLNGGLAGFTKGYSSGRLAQSSYGRSNGMSLGRRGLVASYALGQVRAQNGMIGATQSGTLDSQSQAASTMFDGAVPTTQAPADAAAGATPGATSGSGGAGRAAGRPAARLPSSIRTLAATLNCSPAA